MHTRLPPYYLTLPILLALVILSCTPAANAQTTSKSRLQHVDHWFYYISVDLESDDLDRIIASDYDLIVIDPIITEEYNKEYDIPATVSALQQSGNASGAPKLVLAYIDIGQAESYRTYWQPEWRIGDPDWIVGEDPDGWAENYPVAYWYDEWRAIWFEGFETSGGSDSPALLQLILDAGFDGVYLDWVEAYDDENVITFAENEGVDPVEEMIWFVEDISAYLKAQDPDHIVIAQNAADLAAYDDYLAAIDAIAQEQVWFDGGADGEPEGDCPLPATDADIESPTYVESLPPRCRATYENYPESTLHVSSAEYIDALLDAQARGVFILTVDYALQPENIATVYTRSRALGFVPFVGARSLDRYSPPYP